MSVCNWYKTSFEEIRYPHLVFFCLVSSRLPLHFSSRLPIPLQSSFFSLSLYNFPFLSSLFLIRRSTILQFIQPTIYLSINITINHLNLPVSYSVFKLLLIPYRYYYYHWTIFALCFLSCSTFSTDLSPLINLSYLFFYQLVSLSVCLSFFLFFFLSVRPPFFSLSVCLSAFLSLFLSFCLSLSLSLSPSVCLSFLPFSPSFLLFISHHLSHQTDNVQLQWTSRKRLYLPLW